MALWDWVSGYNTTKNLVISKHMRLPNGTIPSDELYDPESPERTVTLAAKLMTRDEAEAQDALVSGAASSQTYTTSDGETVTGIPVAWNWSQEEGTPNYNGTLTIRIPWTAT